MNNKRKYIFILIIVFILIITISVSYAFYTGLIGNQTKKVLEEGYTTKIDDAILKIEGSLSFNDLDILPGHKNISELKLTATGKQNINYNLIWEGINSLNTPLNYTVYKTSNKIDAKTSCIKQKKSVDGTLRYYEECDISNIVSLGSIISSGTIRKTEENRQIMLKKNEMIEATEEGTEVYYYVVLEYPNLDSSQNIDIGGSFDGTIKINTDIAIADIYIAKIYSKVGLDSKESDIPKKDSGYVFDEAESSCTNNATFSWDNATWALKVGNVTENGTSCTLHFVNYNAFRGKYIGTNGNQDNFTGISTAVETGIYETVDDYGTSYYFRGDGDKLNNWVQFAGFYWRIIRINGNGSIRMIYSGVANGLPSNANKIGTTTQIGTSAYNASRKDNANLGYMYGTIGASTYEETHANTNNSMSKTAIDTWYKTNINEKTDSSGNSYTNYLDKDAGFCNDRSVDNSAFGYTGSGAGRTVVGYGSGARRILNNVLKSIQTPSLKCSGKDRDLFTVAEVNIGNKKLTYPVGLITSDEAVYVGEYGGGNNTSYYLYTGQFYWTMSPAGYGYYNSDDRTRMFMMYPNGYIGYGSVNDSRGLRPVINLKSDIRFKEGTIGSYTNPFVVEE